MSDAEWEMLCIAYPGNILASLGPTVRVTIIIPPDGYKIRFLYRVGNQAHMYCESSEISPKRVQALIEHKQIPWFFGTFLKLGGPDT